jgi:hypothetical protein
MITSLSRVSSRRKHFQKIKLYLMSPPMLKAPRIGVGFKLYIAAQNHVISAMLTHEDEGKEFSVAYLTRRLIYAETRYNFVEKLCLSLY